MAEMISAEEQERSLFLVQIRYLEEELERFKLASEELDKQNQELISNYNQLEKDKRDKTERLKRFVAAKEKRMDELSEELQTRLLLGKRSRETLKQEHSITKQQLQEQIDEVQAEIELQTVTLEENEERIMELRPHVPNIESVEEELLKKKAEHDAFITQLKRNSELACETLIQHFQDYKEHTENCEANKLLGTARALHLEQTELATFLVSEQGILKEEIAAVKKKQKHISCTGRGLCRKLTYLSHLRNFNEQDVKLLKKTFLELHQEKEESIKNQEASLTETEALSQQVNKVHQDFQQRVGDIQRLEKELEKETIRRRQLEGVKDEAKVILKHILEGKDDMSVAQWKILRLVEILDRAAPQNPEPTASSFRNNPRGVRKRHSCYPFSSRNMNPSGSDPSGSV
ncbi:cilia- and flagella-associated protein 157-like [Xiphophorus hellerii]|uniref:cilia- and flagella-associated protein 157-like n=1 Tax=Xiphophorus hellerii TaxID=8084 RepID=UPI0013B38847|nr:cilia- and flagella-associated protein 157-like [Xiphophorus hellerii]